jgi:hypothetical protein
MFAVSLIACTNQDCPNANGVAKRSGGCDSVSAGLEAAGAEDALGQTKKRLIEHGLSEESAEAIVEHNQRYLKIVWEEDQKQWERTVALFVRLGLQPEPVQASLVRFPELAGLLAGSLEAHRDGPLSIVQSLPESSIDRQAVLSLYAQFCDASDATRLAALLRRDQDLVLRLIAHDALSLLLPWLLTEPDNPEVRKVYHDWLRQVLNEALDSASHGDSAALDRAAALLVTHSGRVGELLNQDEAFRRAFLDKYWLRFAHTVRHALDKTPKQLGESGQDEVSERELVWFSYFCDPRVWDYFHQLAEEGDFVFEVFDRWGLVAVDLALAPEYREVRKGVLEALRKADEMVIEALRDENLRRQPLFVELLKRDIKGGPLAKALRELQAAPAEAPRKLAYWQRLSDQALIEELGPPPEGLKTWLPGYAIYYWLRKSSQGRELGWDDHLWAAVDMLQASFIAKGITLIGPLGRSIGKTLGRKGIQEGAELAAKASARKFSPLAFESVANGFRTIMRSVTSHELLQADITAITRFSFHNLQRIGLGGKTFKYLTGLEARVFMRADRRVVFGFADWFEKNSVMGRLLRETAENAGVDLTLSTPLGQEAVQAGIRAAKVGSEAAARQLKAWREHLSLWWIAVHTGALDEAIEDNKRNSQQKTTSAETEN